jgi:heat shock protein HslJ
MKKIKQLSLIFALLTTISACHSTYVTATSETLPGRWVVKSIQDQPIIKSSAELVFSNENKLSGLVSCNHISTSYSTQDNSISIAAIATTRKMCRPLLMEQESTLLQALDKVRRFEINDGQLSLFDQQGTLQLKAKRTKN